MLGYSPPQLSFLCYRVGSAKLGHCSIVAVLLKMGDYYHHSSVCSACRGGSGEDSLSLIGQAVSMYSRAAAAGSPQVTPNLSPPAVVIGAAVATTVTSINLLPA